MVNMSPFLSEEKKVKKSRTINWPFKKSIHKSDSTDGNHIVNNNNNNNNNNTISYKENGCNNCKLFGQPLVKYFNGDSLIPPIMNMLKELYIKGPDTVGIFRKSANARVCRELKTRLEEKPDADLDEFPVIVIGSVFKEFLRTLPDSILQSKNYYKWVDAVNLDNNLDCREKIMKLLSNLPSMNLILLRHFLCVLWHISKRSSDNKMCSINLGVCVGPSLLNVKEASIHRCEEISKQVPKLVAYLIDHCGELLGEASLTLFGQQVLKEKQDSGAEESDSLKSLQENSVYYEHHSRRDDSSLDSIERVLIDSDNRHSNDESDAKNTSNEFENKMSLSNLSRDSGLTLSDTQLYSPDEDNEDDNNELSYSPAVNNNRLLPHLTKSVPHLDTAGLDLNVTFSYGRSVGVSIDGSCHDVVRKRRHQDNNARNRFYLNQNLINGNHTNNNERGSCPNGIYHLQKVDEVDKVHLPVNYSKSYSYGIDNEHVDNCKIEKTKNENDYTPRNGQRYRHRRPPLTAILSHANHSDSHNHKHHNHHQSIFKAHCLRRSSSEESIRINFESTNNNKNYNKNGNSNNNHEPISLPYQVNRREKTLSINDNKNSNQLNSSITRNLMNNNDYNSKRLLQQQQQQQKQQQIPVTRKASININSIENKLQIGIIPSICSSSLSSSPSISSSEINSHRSLSNSSSPSTAQLSKKMNLSPSSISPPSYQETMNRKEIFARIQNNSYSSRQISSSSPYITSSTNQIFQESVRVYNADIQKGSNVFLRAIPVRIKDLNDKSVYKSKIAQQQQQQQQQIHYNQNLIASTDYQCKPALCRLSSEQNMPSTELINGKRPLRFSNSVIIRDNYHCNQIQQEQHINIKERSAKDLTEDWKKEINLSVAQLRSLFNGDIGEQTSPTSPHSPASPQPPPTTTINKHELNTEKETHLNNKDSCVTVIHVTQNKTDLNCNSNESHLHNRCDSLVSSEEESYV